MSAPTWSKKQKVPGFFDTEAPKNTLTPGTYQPYVSQLDANDQKTLLSLANEHNTLKRHVLAIANLRQLYTNLADVRDIKGNVKINLVHLMYDIVSAVLSSLATGIDEEVVKSFIFGHDYGKLLRLVDEKIIIKSPWTN
jgi:hypothetical protein